VADVDGQDDIAFRDQVDLVAFEPWGLLIGGFEGLERDPDPVLRPREQGAGAFGREALTFGFGQLQEVRHGTEVFVVAAVDVDPQELVLAELLDVDVGEVDLRVVPVGVEEPDGDLAQLTRASSAAAITAMTAMRYWRTSIDRSEVGSVSSIANGWCVLSVSIDVLILESCPASFPPWISHARAKAHAPTPRQAADASRPHHNRG
jgi:hypothetical protein